LYPEVKEETWCIGKTKRKKSKGCENAAVVGQRDPGRHGDTTSFTSGGESEGM